MLVLLYQWYKRRFSDPQAIGLLVILLAAFCILFFLSGLLAPLLVALVLAYLLEWPTVRLQRVGCSRTWATSAVLVVFAGILLVMVLIVAPVAWQQGINLTRDLPNMLNKLYVFAAGLPKRYPALVDAGIIDIIVENLRSRLTGLGESLVKYSLASLVGLMTLMIYLVLVPLMVFFLLKDKEQMLNAVRRVLPRNRGLAGVVWQEMNQQITNYIRGKVLEMVAVGFVTWLAFLLLGLNYSLLLAVLVGISVLIPYIGAMVVTIPVIGVGLFQWGLGSDFWTMIAIYLVIQALDGNVLVPILFSEAVNLHPLVIILSVVIFGGMWGFWGVFFAIPLATLVKAVVRAWPETPALDEPRAE
ncbi:MULTISPECIES: AI-2E family transporter [Enterobacterales]|jgi:putative permease|uniref:Permease n=1 Tax=Candidatus Pantoea symbiotica TaxID=1884370 RepID=A0A1I3WBH5_9GAMM|nr:MULTISPECIES: AI-2E family transporter [Enterobacterales]MDY0926354.1 AI-2E family transporter [Enterobacter sp. CFBP8995]MRS18059.1 AI-2E family transporter [Enterobacteriaceae bacterium RIT692]MRT23266.1 AI-2E family transporter [Enterobacteriaceae bacterium RIT697]MRT41898.1 AI-2E family transporter [Enterobacteriaceae bacterium RIT702]KAJ9432244.1 AI-2E family transporter [Pantoea sp. YR343]